MALLLFWHLPWSWLPESVATGPGGGGQPFPGLPGRPLVTCLSPSLALAAVKLPFGDGQGGACADGGGGCGCWPVVREW